MIEQHEPPLKPEVNSETIYDMYMLYSFTVFQTTTHQPRMTHITYGTREANSSWDNSISESGLDTLRPSMINNG